MSDPISEDLLSYTEEQLRNALVRKQVTNYVASLTNSDSGYFGTNPAKCLIRLESSGRNSIGLDVSLRVADDPRECAIELQEGVYSWKLRSDSESLLLLKYLIQELEDLVDSKLA